MAVTDSLSHELFAIFSVPPRPATAHIASWPIGLSIPRPIDFKVWKRSVVRSCADGYEEKNAVYAWYVFVFTSTSTPNIHDPTVRVAVQQGGRILAFVRAPSRVSESAADEI